LINDNRRIAKAFAALQTMRPNAATLLDSVWSKLNHRSVSGGRILNRRSFRRMNKYKARGTATKMTNKNR